MSDNLRVTSTKTTSGGITKDLDWDQRHRGVQGFAEAEQEAAPANTGAYKVVIHAFAVPGRKMTGKMELAKGGGGLTANGDITAYICKACKKVVDPNFVNSMSFACPRCGAAGDAANGLRVDVMFRDMPLDVLAKGVEYYWRATDCNASIYLIRYRHKVARAMVEASKQGKRSENERLRKLLHADTEPVVYPLSRLLKDNLSGADMKERFLQFLQA